MRILKEETIAICIDYQEKLIPAIDRKEEIIKNSSILIRGLKELNVPVYVSQQYTKGLGGTVAPICEAVGAFEPLEKTDFSCYVAENIRAIIEGSKCKNVILCGTEAHICVLQTLIDLKSAGYNVIMVEDCSGSRKENDKKFGIKRAIYEGAIVSTYEAILFELTMGAKSTSFKSISNLVK